LAFDSHRPEEHSEKDPNVATSGVVAFTVNPRKHPADQPSATNLWNPATGGVTDGWTAPAGKQDRITAADGNWIVATRTGYELPLADWSLDVHNVDTGEARTIAESDPSVYGAHGLNGGPLGFAPVPSMASGKVAWAEFVPASEGAISKQIRVYDIATAATSTVATTPDATKVDLYSPGLSGSQLVWVEWTIGAEKATFHLRDLKSGGEHTIPVPGVPYTAALADEGNFLVWDDFTTRAKYALELSTGDIQRYADFPGWGTSVSGHYVSWTPQNNAAGYYDLRTHITRYLEPDPASFTISSTVTGGYFFWQDARTDLAHPLPNGDPNETTIYHFINLP
jgi:hypothetical protein